MTNFLTALASILAASTLYNYVGGRVCFQKAPRGTVFPYVVYFLIGGNQRDTFKNKMDDMLLQVSLFSTSESVTEIATMYDYQKTALDDAKLSITGSTCVWCTRQGPPMANIDELDVTEDGAEWCRHWATNYSVMVET